MEKTSHPADYTGYRKTPIYLIFLTFFICAGCGRKNVDWAVYKADAASSKDMPNEATSVAATEATDFMSAALFLCKTP